ncbi:MAG: hypothetical protein BAJALOKI2v1_640014 [Promethearchaeota archaeon]|nr:MAG: hypothetical protein BAJALOKI2v1_640014 [Candidatus Lokiarchaeota archaeon]
MSVLKSDYSIRYPELKKSWKKNFPLGKRIKIFSNFKYKGKNSINSGIFNSYFFSLNPELLKIQGSLFCNTCTQDLSVHHHHHHHH